MQSDSVAPRKKIGSVKKFLLGAILVSFGAVDYVHMSRSTQGHFLDINQDGVLMQANVTPIRIFNAGELSTHISLATQFEVLEEIWDNNPLDPSKATLGGKSTNKHFFSLGGQPEEPGVCIVRTFASPYAKISSDQVYEFTNEAKSPVIFPQRETFFSVKTHEIYHCIYNYAEGHNIEDPDGFSKQYISSVMETAADLGMTLQYASQTGSFDIWYDLVRPERLIGSQSSHLDHRTAWAMDVLLADVNPTTVFGSSREQVSELLIELMAKHFEHQGMIINPDLPGAPVKPAMRAMIDELGAASALGSSVEGKHVDRSQVNPGLINRLKLDMSITLARNHQAHMFHLNEDQSRDYSQRAGDYARKWGFEYKTLSFRDSHQPNRGQRLRQSNALDDLAP